jgi:hypothetical protein
MELVVRKAVVGQSELTDGAWERIVPLLPENGRRGKQWKDHRTVVNGIPVEAQDRGALARPARTLWLVADLLRPLRPLAARWDLGPAPSPSADEVRRGGRGRVGGQRR